MIKRIPLADLLVSSRIGIQAARTEEAYPLIYPAIQSRLLKNQDLLNTESLELAGNEGELISLKDNNNANALCPDEVLVTTKFIHRVGSAKMPKEKPPLPLYVSSNSAVLRFNECLCPCYMTLWFRSRAAEMAIKAMAKIYSRNMHSVSLKVLLTLPVPVPTLNQQLKLVNFFNETRQLRQQYGQTIEQRQSELQKQLQALD